MAPSCPRICFVFGSLLVLELKKFQIEQLFARVAVVHVLLNSTTRLGVASDSTCETSLSFREACRPCSPGEQDRYGLSTVSPYGVASKVGGVSEMMTRPVEKKINDVIYRHGRLEKE